MSTPRTGRAAPLLVPEGSVYLANEMLPGFLGQLPNGIAYGKMLYQNGQAHDYAYLYTNPAFQRQTELQDLTAQPDIFARYARVAAGGPPEHFQVFPDTFQAPYSVQVFSPKPEYFVCIVHPSPPPLTDSQSSPSARRYLCVLEDQTEMICRFLTDGTILYANDAYCRFFGKPRGSLIGQTWQPTAWAEDLPMINAKLATLSPAQPVVTIENRLIAANGSLRWGQFVNRGFFDSHGRLLEMQSVGRDITEQKQMEAAMRESERKFAKIFNNSPVGIAISRVSDGTFIDANEAFLRIYGYSRAELIGRSSAELGLWDNLQYRAEIVATVLEQNTLHNFEVQYKPKSGGSTRTLLASMDTVDIGGERCLLGIVIDITERQLIQQALQHENEKNQALLRNASDGIHILDIDGNVIEASDAFCSLLGYSRTELLGMNISQWDTGQPASVLIDRLRRQFTHPVRALSVRRHRRKDGSYFDVEISSVPLKLDGKAVLFGSSRDISVRKALEKKLQKSAQEIEDLYEHAPCGYHSISPDGTILRINNTELAWLEYRREDVVGKLKITDFFTPASLALFKQSFPQFLQDGHIEDKVFELVSKSGKRRQVMLSATAVRDADGHFLMSRSVFYDITELKQAEQKFHTLYQDFVAFLDNTTDYVYFLDPDQHFRFCSQTVAAISHQSTWQAMIGKPIQELFPQDVVRHYDEDNQALLRTGKPLLNKLDPYYDEQGNKGWLITNKWPLFAADGHTISGLFGISRDISELLAMEQQLKLREALFYGLFDQSIFLAVILDAQGNLLEINSAALKFIGPQSQTVIGQYFPDMPWWADNPDRQQLIDSLQSALQGIPGKFEAIHPAADGELSRIIFNTMPITLDNDFRLAVIGEDVTERWRIEQSLRESEKRFRMLADNAPVLIWMAGFDASRLYFNKVWLDFTGRTLAQERHQGWTENVHPDDLPHYLAAYQAAVANREKFAVDYRLRRKDGAYRWLTDQGVPRYDDQGNFFGYIGSCIDITERHNQEEQAKQQALYDPLTKLANRRLLHERLEHTLAALKHHHGYAALLFLDLDNFKPLNDLHSHEIGDLLLIEVARRITYCVRDIDTVARFGGDEFVVLISKLDTVEAPATACVHRVAERIRNQLAQPYTLALPSGGDQAIVHHCTSSIGATLFGPEHSQAEQILKHADQAMYQAKANGRNRVQFYTPNDSV